MRTVHVTHVMDRDDICLSKKYEFDGLFHIMGLVGTYTMGVVEDPNGNCYFCELEHFRFTDKDN